MLPGFGGHWVVESHYHLCLEPKIIISSELTSFKSKKRSFEPNPRRIHPGRKIIWIKASFSGSSRSSSGRGWSTVESKIPMIFCSRLLFIHWGTRNRESLEKVRKVRVFFGRVDLVGKCLKRVVSTGGYKRWFHKIKVKLPFFDAIFFNMSKRETVT